MRVPYAEVKGASLILLGGRKELDCARWHKNIGQGARRARLCCSISFPIDADAQCPSLRPAAVAFRFACAGGCLCEVDRARAARGIIASLTVAFTPPSLLCASAATLPEGRGIYALVLYAAAAHRIQVGRLGRLAVREGYYIYVGSALGPGGIGARVGHHAQRARHPHWHIDFLRCAAQPVEAWCLQDTRACEHEWAAMFDALPSSSIPMRGFGASDCRCPAHLFSFDAPPSFEVFRRSLPESARESLNRTSMKLLA